MKIEGRFIMYYCVLWLVISAATIKITHSLSTTMSINHGSCTQPEASDLGSMDTLSKSGIVAESFITADGTDPPFVRIIRHHLVCEVAGFIKNTVGIISVLVEYDCRGLFCPGDGSPNTTVTVTSQFQFQCNPETSTFRKISTSLARIDNSQANFSTPLDNKCGACSDPETGAIGDRNNDPVTLCGGIYIIYSNNRSINYNFLPCPQVVLNVMKVK